jgi:hypothetical protein
MLAAAAKPSELTLYLGDQSQIQQMPRMLMAQPEAICAMRHHRLSSLKLSIESDRFLAPGQDAGESRCRLVGRLKAFYYFVLTRFQRPTTCQRNFFY